MKLLKIGLVLIGAHLSTYAVSSSLVYAAIRAIHIAKNKHLTNSHGIEKLYQELQQLKNKNDKIMTLMVYIAADNDLHIFAWKNIRQLAEIAPENVNIVVFLTEPGKNKKTQVYLIEKNKSTPLNPQNTLKLDSGSPKTLVDFCSFCIQNYPAHEYALFLWDHGTGIIDPFKKPSRKKIASTAELFSINPVTLQLEVDRTISFLDYISAEETATEVRGICFDDTYNSYLTNEKLEVALKEIKEKALFGKKFLIIGMDACLMAMTEVASLVKNYAEYMVASQEVELGAGWRYDKVMKHFLSGLPLEAFPAHIVKSYKEAYEKITPDYTLSAIQLKNIDTLEQCIDNLAQALIKCLTQQAGSSVKSAIKMSKEKIGFDEISYIDLRSFCEKIIHNSTYIRLLTDEHTAKQELINRARECILATESVVASNAAGKNVPYAHGISIYFPERTIHSSYTRTAFALKNNWFHFLLKYIAS